MAIEAGKIYAVWLRETKRFTNSKSRIIGSLAMPLFFLFALGAGIGGLVPEFDYQSFILPGIIGMTILFNSVFSGVSIIWDRELGYLKELLVAPTSRFSIVIGRALGGATTSVLQGFVILIIGVLLGLASPGLFEIFLALLVMIVFSALIVSIGIGLASVITEVETFQLIVNLVIFPLFFLSNALFPLDKMPGWLQTLSLFNPVSYAVDALRGLIIGVGVNSLALNFAVLLVGLVIMFGIAGTLFDRTSI
ncbi:MAG: ABC transporter permease [Candidatus Diapherotrites archaeon]|uniref:ABC transporter permease n=1 Tax=Candidatus Iainarchaeum sp. TaxID=3101447 RepID=A0A8T4LEI7_9ARCH|nr:ABC transporter permease [Candidatus Diapherotrites archaeon]